ncbi:MAG TPA: alpha/beta hydrolase [Cytophagales bacterium]|nr:alpha/beta hydrolase [Cytophagales bacterium]
MKRTATLVIFLVGLIGTTAAQDMSGTWKGLLEISSMQLEVFFNLKKTEDGYSGTMDVPTQGAKGLPLDKVEVSDNQIVLGFSGAGITYEGEYQGDELIAGTFHQGPVSEPLNLTREEQAAPELERPQEPKGPFPYTVEEVTIPNEAAGLSLAGTLTLPEGDAPVAAAILISGSGPQNRDEELMGHKPFWVLADHLTRNGIAVLRYDDRGVGQSTGEFQGATSQDFSTDVAAVMSYLKTRAEIDPNLIGLVGHSEGGLIAPLVATDYEGVGFIVSMGGPGVTGKEIILEQQRLITAAQGVPVAILDANKDFHNGAIDIVLANEDAEEAMDKLEAHAETVIEKYAHLPGFAQLVPAELAEGTYQQYGGDWFRYFLVHDPAPLWEQVECPVLSVIGENDLQVPAEMNTTAIEQSLKEGGNQDFEAIILPGLNHLFQESETGSPAEYATITQTMSPSALEAITEWILELED